jgi:hypothetical protein
MDAELNQVWKAYNGRDLPSYTEKIPFLVLCSLVHYVVNRHSTGNFLTAFLSNELNQAISYADNESLAAFREINYFIYNHCPSKCWGSPTKVSDWLTNKEARLLTPKGD